MFSLARFDCYALLKIALKGARSKNFFINTFCLINLEYFYRAVTTSTAVSETEHQCNRNPNCVPQFKTN